MSGRASPPPPPDDGGGLAEDLERIEAALAAAEAALGRFTPGAVQALRKAGGDPVTAADTEVDGLLRRLLPRDGEGWLSEETLDDLSRTACRRVWVVDPLDGTREFVAGIPEWSVSIGLVVDGEPVAGGVLNPATGERFVGARGHGVRRNGEPAQVVRRERLEGAVVLASRSEVGRGRWERFAGAPFAIRPVGSVAYKLALVAAGRADATWTLVPKHEWDVAAGVALVLAGGGAVRAGAPEETRFNRERPLLTRLLAAHADLLPAIEAAILASGGSGT